MTAAGRRAVDLVLADVRAHSPVGSAGGAPQRFRGDVSIAAGRIASLHPDGAGTPRAAERRECDGRWLLPAFCDSHLHLHTLAEQRAVLRLPRRIAPPELGERLSARAGGGAEWIVAQGWADPLAAELLPSPRAFLDAIHPSRPVWLFAYDHHRALLNSAALAAVGIDPADSQGVLLEGVLDRAWCRVPPLPADLPGAVRDLHSLGIAAATSFDGSAARERCRRAIEEEGLRLRLRHSIPLEEFRARHDAGDLPPLRLDPESPFLAPWVKVFLDGTLGSHTAWLRAAYDDLGGRGDERIPADERRRIASLIAESGYGVCLHAIGDAAVAAAIEIIEEVRRERTGIVADRIEHGECLDLDDLPRLARSGATVSMQPCHLLEDAAIAPERWGERCRGAFAARSMLAAEVPVVFGSDAPIETADPWVDLRAAIDRRDRAGRFPGGWIPEERLGFEEALAARTVGAAAANHLPAGWGRIAPGAPADLQLLECGDPARVGSIEEARLVGLLVGGEWQELAVPRAGAG